MMNIIANRGSLLWRPFSICSPIREKIGVYLFKEGLFYPRTAADDRIFDLASTIFDKVILPIEEWHTDEIPYLGHDSWWSDHKNVSVVTCEDCSVLDLAVKEKANFFIRGVRDHRDLKKEMRLRDEYFAKTGIETLLFIEPEEFRPRKSYFRSSKIEKGLTLDYQNPQLAAAGVVPYARGDDGRMYVLLGRQALYPHRSAGLWKGFGGRQDAGENLINTALREAKEEMRGVLGPDSACYHPEKLPLDRLITTEDYRSKYLQLMVPVPWDKEAPERFQKLTSTDLYRMEKLSICWVPLEGLYQKLSRWEELEGVPHVWSGSDHLPLASDFVETLLANFKNPEDAIHLLAKNIMPISPTVSGVKES